VWCQPGEGNLDLFPAIPDEHPRSADAAAQTGMARASMSAGIAFTNAILGATHAISHQLGGALDLPHGVLNALLLPHVVRFKAAEFPDKFRPIVRALGADASACR
jgi:alcohol dehydrogenase